MAKEVNISYKCDVCKSVFTEEEYNEGKKISHFDQFPVIFRSDQTEGRPCEPYISLEKIDLCRSCALKSVNLIGYGASGCNTYVMAKSKEDKKN